MGGRHVERWTGILPAIVLLAAVILLSGAFQVLPGPGPITPLVPLRRQRSRMTPRQGGPPLPRWPSSKRVAQLEWSLIKFLKR